MKRLLPFILCTLLLVSCSKPEVRQTDTSPVPPPVTQSAETQDEKTTDENSVSEKPIPKPSPQPAKEKPLPSEGKNEPKAQLVSITVLGLNGQVIYSAEKEHREKMTVLDLLLETASEKNVSVTYSGGKSSAYITGIGGLSEKDNGPTSGWVYTVNGESIMRPSGKCLLNPDDKVVFKYITEFSY